MASYSRREFGKIVAAGVPLVALVQGKLVAAAGGVTLGVSTYSFQTLPRAIGDDNIDDVIRALKSAGARTIELASANFEPGPPEMGEFVKGGTAAYPSLIKRSPQQLAALKASVRRGLREWRFGTDLSFFRDVRAKFSSAGIAIHAVAYDYTDAFTDEEIEITLRQAEALGVSVVSSPLTMAGAARLAPIVAHHNDVRVAIHNQIEGNSTGAIGVRELAQALALSPAFTLKLDIGNLTASNRNAVDELQAQCSRVSHVLVQDRLRNGGAPQPFGEGDTPIAAVLAALKTSTPPIPAFVQYGYFGLNPPADEVKHCLEFLQGAL
jgi:sugar phosphate isomerase/epimerase